MNIETSAAYAILTFDDPDLKSVIIHFLISFISAHLRAHRQDPQATHRMYIKIKIQTMGSHYFDLLSN